ncbi:SOS response-associated peptidase [Patescibacteria group bacterium]
MCGRFSMYYAEDLKNRFDLEGSIMDLENRYNIAPGQKAAVILRNSPNKGILMKWGLIPYWAKDPAIGFKMINARSESLAEKPSFKRPFLHQRCLIPTSGFYEWKKLDDKTKVPYYLKLKKQKIFALAGLYDKWQDIEGKEISTFTIITTEPNKLISPIHARMPAILKKEAENTWLDNNLKDINVLTKLLKPFNAQKMEAYTVSKKVNSPENDNKDLIEPVDPEEEKIQPKLL